jgi:FdhD protein
MASLADHVAASGAAAFRFEVLMPQARSRNVVDRPLAIEAPIAIEYNGIGYAVMMATPIDLEDFAIGFSLSDEVIDSASDIKGIDVHEAEQGWIVRIQLPPEKIAGVEARARLRVSESSCGLCGLENLEQVMRPLPTISAMLDVTEDAIFASLRNLGAHQPLNAATGAAHAAAFCGPDGTILAVREDVGRHNALDKLLGALAKAEIAASGGFMLLTARCSFELVQKAVIANCPLLVTISAPTSLAAAQAKRHGLRLISLARSDSALSLQQ